MSIVRLALLVTVLAAPSCSLFEGTIGLVDEVAPTMTEPQLRERLSSFADGFSRTIQGAADDVSASTSDQASRKAILLWKMNVIAECREAATRDDPRAALSDCWTLCVQLRRYFDAAAKESNPQWMDEPSRLLALDASRKVEQDIREIAVAWLGSKNTRAAGEQIEQFASDNPISGRFGRRSYDRPSHAGNEFPSIENIVKATLSPFNVVGGIDRTAGAVHELSVVGDRFTSVVDQLPESTRWEMQLAMYDFEARPTVVALRQSMSDLAESSQVMAQAARDLPDELGAVVTSTAGDVGTAAESLRETADAFERTVVATRGLAADLDGTLARTEEVIAAADRASGSFGRAGESWEGVFRAIEDLTGEDDPAASAPDVEASHGETEDDGFDVTEYGEAADRINAAAVELRAGIAELGAFIHGLDVDEVTRAVDATTGTALDRTSAEAVVLVDHVTKRAVQLLVLVFVLGLVFTLVTRRWKQTAG